MHHITCHVTCSVEDGWEAFVSTTRLAHKDPLATAAVATAQFDQYVNNNTNANMKEWINKHDSVDANKCAIVSNLSSIIKFNPTAAHSRCTLCTARQQRWLMGRYQRP